MTATPSPQSVVVPVEPTREMWAAGGNAACQAANQHHDKVVEGVWSAMLAAAPATSSLAGGEVNDEWADRFCEAVNWSPDGEECKTVEGELRCTTFRQIAKGHILSAIATNPYPDNAALSPEAPAREGVTHPDAQPFERFPELALHIERMAMTGLVGSGISWDAFLRELNAALPPRHEAPADPCKSCNGTGRELGSAFNRCADCEAPAEGAGEDDAWIWLNGHVECDPADRDYSADEMVDAFMAGQSAAIRARSSAPEARDIAYQDAHDTAVEMGYPSLTEALEDLDRLKEAREGETVAWRDRALTALKDARTQLEQYEVLISGETYNSPDMNALITELSTHPAVPSADKLREADGLFRALRDQSWDLRCFSVPTGGDDADIGWRVIGHWQAEPCERTIAEVFSDDPAEAVRQALAALKAEGA